MTATPSRPADAPRIAANISAVPRSLPLLTDRSLMAFALSPINAPWSATGAGGRQTAELLNHGAGPTASAGRSVTSDGEGSRPNQRRRCSPALVVVGRLVVIVDLGLFGAH